MITESVESRHVFYLSFISCRYLRFFYLSDTNCLRPSKEAAVTAVPRKQPQSGADKDGQLQQRGAPLPLDDNGPVFAVINTLSRFPIVFCSRPSKHRLTPM